MNRIIENNRSFKCCAKNCSKCYKNDLHVKFYAFPDAAKRFVYKRNVFGNLEKVDQLNAWERALKINEVKETNDKNLHRISNKNVVHNIIWDH